MRQEWTYRKSAEKISPLQMIQCVHVRVCISEIPW